MRPIYLIVLIVMTMIGSVASLFLKRASSSKTIFELLKNYNIYIGGFLYLASALLNIYILRYLAYSTVLPFTAITYVWTMVLSYWILKEKITYKKMIGVGLIIIGAIFII